MFPPMTERLSFLKTELKLQSFILALALSVFVGARTLGPGCLDGPYIQCVTTNSVIVRWRTTSYRPIRCTFEYRLGVDKQWRQLYSDSSTDGHQLTITNLIPGSRYLYRISTPCRRIAAGPGVAFQTAPLLSSYRSIRTWVLGDSGTGNQHAYAVREGALRCCKGKAPDIILMLGDNAYEKGSRFDHHRGLFLPYREQLWSALLCPALGNHDTITRATEPEHFLFEEIFSVYPRVEVENTFAVRRRTFYSFNWSNIHFVCLDSNAASISNQLAVISWLKQDLQGSKDQDWLIAYWHHSPYSFGHHDSDEEQESTVMRTTFLPLLEEYGADLILTGHNHAYGRTDLIYRHYDEGRTFVAARHVIAPLGTNVNATVRKPRIRGTGQGTVYVVLGCSGKLESKSLDHPAMTMKLNVYGSLLLDVDRLRLKCTFVDHMGTVRDAFGIVKDADQLKTSETL